MADPLKSNLWRTLFALACVVILGASFYAEENWRGVEAWTDCKRSLEARGEILDWTNYIPAAVPDDENIFKAPKMTEWFVRQSITNYSNDLNRRLANPATTSPITSEIDASNYLAWSAAFDPDFDTMRDALKRPRARMDGDYEDPFYGTQLNSVSFYMVTRTLAQRAKCHLLLGEPEPALRDLTLLHDLARLLASSKASVTLRTVTTHTVITGFYVDAVASGTATRTWREPELAMLEKQLQEINLVPEVAASFREERAAMCHLLETIPTDKLMHDYYDVKSVSDLGWWFMPGGWIYQNMAVIAPLEQKTIESFELTNNCVLPYKAVAAVQSSKEVFRHSTPWNFLAAMSVPNFTKTILMVARNQTWVNQAEIVCALERYRLANGKYPETLATLVPQFITKIPPDLIGGKPLNYSRKDDQDFLLYSIGWNEADDGGITAFTGDGQEDRERGDWVWHYPTQ
jgi:hypothetical protein